MVLYLKLYYFFSFVQYTCIECVKHLEGSDWRWCVAEYCCSHILQREIRKAGEVLKIFHVLARKCSWFNDNKLKFVLCIDFMSILWLHKWLDFESFSQLSKFPGIYHEKFGCKSELSIVHYEMWHWSKIYQCQ